MPENGKRMAEHGAPAIGCILRLILLYLSFVKMR
jgi:hypothetical protein